MLFDFVLSVFPTTTAAANLIQPEQQYPDSSSKEPVEVKRGQNNRTAAAAIVPQ